MNVSYSKMPKNIMDEIKAFMCKSEYLFVGGIDELDFESKDVLYRISSGKELKISYDVNLDALRDRYTIVRLLNGEMIKWMSTSTSYLDLLSKCYGIESITVVIGRYSITMDIE